MNTVSFKLPLFVKLLAVSCLIFALAGNKAFAGGGAPDPSDTPLYKALAVQVAAIDTSFLKLVAAGGGSLDRQGGPNIQAPANRALQATAKSRSRRS